MADDGTNVTMDDYASPSDVGRHEALQVIESEISRITRVDARLAEIDADIWNKVSEIIDGYHEEVASLEHVRNTHLRNIAFIAYKHFTFLTGGRGKTIKLRLHTVFVRDSPESLEVDAKEAETWLRSRGLWRMFSKQPKRELDITHLKRFPDVIAQAPEDIMHLTRMTKLYIEAVVESRDPKRRTGPLSIEYPPSEDTDD